ncbi:MAG: Asp-tRNA(Asn)/Glu-tRNA(Gln) amidotransferase GatCAB subunit C [Planctomycetes bacterium]|jgi:aspartyl-tRNA(Asn)/glutamyl-tRNA(Gln) amidotransferase subunit C|nr:Asp-tRNA(Asn)/Glu-tRNA(Gln) amidotransferase GatCAB subunit C [Planctomycetota bacterium]MDP6408795.1 Asp-tRNA(Asn)/Glu-tRNA(Gln) amidotransferase subunit GatC [Planctomycetota bacterium]
MADTDRDLVLQTAALARLQLDEREAQHLGPQFEAILRQFRQLEGVDVGDAEPTTGATGVRDVLRADEVRPSLEPGVVLANAPHRVGDFYAVPKTVGGPD